MPIELQVIRASEFIRVDAHEHLDVAASKEVLRTLVQACRKRGLDCAMLDLRALPVPARPLFTVPELTALVGTFREAGFSLQQRLAILYRHDVHGGIHSFAFISRMRGLHVRAFSEFEAALVWLSAKPAKPAKPVTRSSHGVPIPVTTRTAGGKRPPAGPIAGIRGRSTPVPVRRRKK